MINLSKFDFCTFISFISIIFIDHTTNLRQIRLEAYLICNLFNSKHIGIFCEELMLAGKYNLNFVFYSKDY
ncbi:hypothetical protein BpHYR1_038772 [Brachionus plicatilis]|uniref:Uncharacterized protein n=1 Tax=Brachionus plicatilis TaxID=10195 RepID=A0A3M7SZ36_BRAPC|nr:hypothetical protein BpHYR1_038772 [Brachionus plicatilis]